MKYAFYFLLAFFPALAYGGAPAPGCRKDSDACTAAPAPRSPFLEAAADHGKAPASARPGKTVKKIAPQPASVEVSTVAATPASAERPASASNPLWAIFAAGGLAGLYLYLNKDPGKKKRK